MSAQGVDYVPLGYTVAATATTGYLIAQLYMSLLTPLHGLVALVAIIAYGKACLSLHQRLPALITTTELATQIYKKAHGHIQSGCTMLYPAGGTESEIVHVLLRQSGDSIIITYVGWGASTHAVGDVTRTCEISSVGRIVRRTNGARLDPLYRTWCQSHIRRQLECMHHIMHTYSPRREKSRV
jgi:hypothetical protein